MDGMELLRRVYQRPNPPEVIMLTGQATVETAVEAKLGAYDYLTKPYSITELDVRVKQAADKRRLRVDNVLREQLARQSALPEIVSVSEVMKEAIRLIERVAPSEASVLITGNGNGKRAGGPCDSSSVESCRCFVCGFELCCVSGVVARVGVVWL